MTVKITLSCHSKKVLKIVESESFGKLSAENLRFLAATLLSANPDNLRLVSVMSVNSAHVNAGFFYRAVGLRGYI